MEVKFADEQSIYRFVMSVVRKALGANDLVPSLEVNGSKGSDESFASLRHAALPRHFSGDFGNNERTSFPSPFSSSAQERSQQGPSGLDKLFSDIPRLRCPQSGSPQQFAHGTREDEAQEGKAIWQLHNKYILSQIRTGLMIVDQHVAHERILYERALASFNNAVPVSQQLLFPSYRRTLLRRFRPCERPDSSSPGNRLRPEVVRKEHYRSSRESLPRSRQARRGASFRIFSMNSRTINIG